MQEGNAKRGKRLVIVMIGIALIGAIVAARYSRHRDYIPATQPSPMQSVW